MFIFKSFCAFLPEYVTTNASIFVLFNDVFEISRILLDTEFELSKYILNELTNVLIFYSEELHLFRCMYINIRIYCRNIAYRVSIKI